MEVLLNPVVTDSGNTQTQRHVLVLFSFCVSGHLITTKQVVMVTITNLIECRKISGYACEVVSRLV